MTGREGEGGGGDEYDGECFFDDDSDDDDDDDDDEYDDDDKYDDTEDGKGSRGGANDGGNPTMTFATSSAGRPSAAWGIGCRSSAPTPPSLTTTTTTLAAAAGGCRAPPPPCGPFRPAGRRLSLSMSPTSVDGGGMRAFGAWSYAWWRRKVRAVVLIRQVLIQPGVDDGGKRSDMTLAGLHGRHRQTGEGGGGGAARATATTTKAAGEGGKRGDGGGGGGGRRGRGLLGGPRHSN